MKSLAITIAAITLAVSAAFAAPEVEVKPSEIRPEGEVQKPVGTQITNTATAGNRGVRTEKVATPPTAVDNILNPNSAQANAAAKEIGGTCDATSKLSTRIMAILKAAKKALIGGDVCAQKFDPETAETVAEMDQAMLGQLKIEGATNGHDPKLGVKGQARVLLAAAKTLAAKVKDSVVGAVARIKGTCTNMCDNVEAAFCQGPVLDEAAAEAASI